MNPEERRARNKAAVRRYQLAHPDRVRALKPAQGARHYAKNREALNERHKAYNAAHPEQARAQAHRRRRAPGSLSAQNVREIEERDGGFCAYCLRPGACHLEHCTPLSRGGWNAEDNAVMACASCNLRKGRKTVLEFCCGQS
jgi:5-methylcytosine-specific restriction endonuclease McrA